MFINEIPLGSNVVLSCFAGSKWIKFSIKTDRLHGPNANLSVERAVRSKFIITEPARTQGKIVSFPPNYRYEISYAINGKFNVWSNVRVINFEIDRPKKKVLVIATNEQSRRSERRRSYRLKMNVKGEVRFGEDVPSENVTVRDISATGVGILAADKPGKVKVGEVMTVTFTEDKRDQSFVFRARIVRIESAGNGKSIFGGVIIGDRSKKEVSTYIEKERKMVAQK